MFAIAIWPLDGLGSDMFLNDLTSAIVLFAVVAAWLLWCRRRSQKTTRSAVLSDLRILLLLVVLNSGAFAAYQVVGPNVFRGNADVVKASTLIKADPSAELVVVTRDPNRFGGQDARIDANGVTNFTQPGAVLNIGPNVSVSKGSLTAEIHHASVKELVLSRLATAPSPLAYFVISLLAFGIVRRSARGEIFIDRNVRALRGIAIVCAVIMPLRALEVAAAGTLVTSVTGAADTSLVFEFSQDPGPVLLAIGVFALAEVWAYGLRLRRDTVGLV